MYVYNEHEVKIKTGYENYTTTGKYYFFTNKSASKLQSNTVKFLCVISSVYRKSFGGDKTSLSYLAYEVINALSNLSPNAF